MRDDKAMAKPTALGKISLLLRRSIEAACWASSIFRNRKTRLLTLFKTYNCNPMPTSHGFQIESEHIIAVVDERCASWRCRYAAVSVGGVIAFRHSTRVDPRLVNILRRREIFRLFHWWYNRRF